MSNMQVKITNLSQRVKNVSGNMKMQVETSKPESKY